MKKAFLQPYSSCPPNDGQEKQRGFTLLEMLVAIAVAITFLSGMFFTQGDFDSTVRLSSTARDVALLVRQAQTYGAGGGVGSDIEIGQPHGVYINEGNPNEIILYADEDGSPGFESSSADRAVETLNLSGPFMVSDICLAGTGSISSCENASAYPGDLSIFFVRPSLEANFQSDSGSAGSAAQAAIEITHEPSGATRIVKIDKTGFISTP